MVQATINSDKHYVHFPVASVASGARTSLTVLDVDNDLGNASSVRVGAIVKAIYVEMWADGDTASKTGFACITKLGGTQSGPTYAETLNMTTYLNKKNVLESHQGLMPSGGNQLAFFKHWVKIPKGKQRMGLGDTVKISISATGTAINFCGIVVFKEYY